MYVQAISRRNIRHAIPDIQSTLPALATAVCGAPVINPRSEYRWEFHGTDDGTNRNWGVCKNCARIVSKEK